MNREIDKKRNSAFSMVVGSVEEGPVTSIQTIDDRLYTIKERSIYVLKLADDTDPRRTNAEIPHTHQKILSYGSASPFVGKTLLTAICLCDPTYVSSKINWQAVIRCSFEALKNISSINDSTIKFSSDVRAALKLTRENFTNGSMLMPSIEHVHQRCTDVIQKAEHSIQALYQITQLFYPESRGKFFEGFENYIRQTYGSEDPFTEFLSEDALPFLLLIRHARHCIEHPKRNEQITTFDFTLNASGQILPPAIKILHPKSALDSMAISEFFNALMLRIPHVFENMLAFLCSKNLEPFGQMRFELVSLPKNARREKHVRFSYQLVDSDGKPIGTV